MFHRPSEETLNQLGKKKISRKAVETDPNLTPEDRVALTIPTLETSDRPSDHPSMDGGEIANAINITLGVKVTAGDDERITIKRTSSRQGILDKAINAADTVNTGIVRACLKLEINALNQLHGVRLESTSRIKDYLDQLLERKLLGESCADELKVAGLTNGLIYHWRRVADDMQNQYAWGEVSPWKLYLSDQNRINTPWSCRTYWEQYRVGGWDLDQQASLLSEEASYTVGDSWLSHTTASSSAEVIHYGNRQLISSRVNFSADSVVSRDQLGEDQVTLLFKLEEIGRNLRLATGESTAVGEKERTSYFPVPLEFAVAAIPTSILMHRGGFYWQGNYTRALHPQRVQLYR